MKAVCWRTVLNKLYYLFVFGFLTLSCTINTSISKVDSESSTSPGDAVTSPGSQTPSASFNSLGSVSGTTATAYLVSGSCSYVSNLQIYLNGSLNTTTSCSAGSTAANGTFSSALNLSSVSDGNLSFQIYNASTGSSLTSAQTVLKDTVAPTAQLSSPPASTNSLTTLTSAILTTDTQYYSYKVGVAASTDCSNSSGYSSFISVGTSLSADLSGISDGNLRLCIVAKDLAGNQQSYSSASIYNWTKDTTSPTATLSGTPSVTTNSSSYNITVGGTGVTHYMSKLGLSASTDCSNSSGYSSSTAIASSITGTLGSGDGLYKLCVVGRTSTGSWQLYSSATSFSWTLDTTAPTLSISSPSGGAYAYSSNQSSYSVTSSCSENGVSVSIGATSTVNAGVVSGSGTCTGGSVTVSLNISTLPEGGITLVSSQTDAAGNSGSSTGVSITKDTTAPTLSGTLTDGTYYNSISQTPSLSWSAGSDTGGSGVQKYQIAIGSSSGGTQIQNWTDVGNVTTYQVGSLSLTDGTTYYPSVRVVDVAGNTSTSINGDGWIPDVTGPSAPSNVEDGDAIASTSYSSWIGWGASTDSGSGLAGYEVRIVDGTNSPITSWTNAGTSLGYGFTGLSLTEGQIYKAEVRALDNLGNTSTTTLGNGWSVIAQGWKQQAYIKAPNSDAGDNFGNAVAIDGDTAIVGAKGESSNQTTITNGTTASSDNSLVGSGAAYVFKRVGSNWIQEAYLKAPNAGSNDNFGNVVAISGDTAIVAATYEDSNQTTITNGTSASSDNSAADSGAVYVFKRTGTTWAQEAYLKAANANNNDLFGSSISISGDSILIGAPYEASNQTTITNGTTASADNSAVAAGAAYVYKRSGSTWTQEAFLKAPNPNSLDQFGTSVALFGDTAAVGAVCEASNQTTITNGSTASADNSVSCSGAVYVFKRTGTTWAQEAYIKAVNANLNDFFGFSLGLYNNTLVVGAPYEDSNQTSITNGTTASSDNSLLNAGAIYVYKRSGTTWTQEAYLKPSNLDAGDNFGFYLSIFQDTIAVGVNNESSNQTTITNGSTASSDNSASSAGTVYVFKRAGTTWSQSAYIKAPNAESLDNFGCSIGVSGSTLITGAYGESSNQTSITNGTTASSDNSASGAGAAYVFKFDQQDTWQQQAYIKAVNADTSDFFGSATSISNDTLVVGTITESSNQTTITNGTTASADNSASNSGAAYVYKRTGLTWAQEAYLKAPNSELGDLFGISVSISGDTLVVGAPGEASNQTTITNGTTASANNSAISAGAAYVFKRTGSSWDQEAYLKASNSEMADSFGMSVAVSDDTIIVGAQLEDSNQTTITNGATSSSNNTASASGAAYVYKRTGTTWAQEAYLVQSQQFGPP